MYKEYADVKFQIKLLETKVEELKTTLLEEIKKTGEDKVENEYGKFTIGRRNNWTYSPKLTTLGNEVKSKQIDEQEKGIAKVKVTEFISFKEISNE